MIPLVITKNTFFKQGINRWELIAKKTNQQPNLNNTKKPL